MSQDKGKENDRLSGMTRDDGALDVLLHAHRTKKTQASVVRERSKIFSDITNTPRLSREVKRKLQDVEELMQIRATETEDAMSKLSNVVAKRSKIAHSEYVSNRLAREAKIGLVDDPTWQLPESQVQAKLDDLVKKHAATLDENSSAASSWKRPLRSTTAAAKPPPLKKARARLDDIPPYPPPQNATSTSKGQYNKIEAMKILHGQPKRVRNAWINEWIEKELVPITTRDNIVKNLRKFEKNLPQSEFWGPGRRPILSIATLRKKLEPLQAKGLSLDRTSVKQWLVEAKTDQTLRQGKVILPNVHPNTVSRNLLLCARVNQDTAKAATFKNHQDDESQTE